MINKNAIDSYNINGGSPFSIWRGKFSRSGKKAGPAFNVYFAKPRPPNWEIVFEVTLTEKLELKSRVYTELYNFNNPLEELFR